MFDALCRAVYELTAVVAHVVDAAEEGPVGAAPEGHLVAHVKVMLLQTFLISCQCWHVCHSICHDLQTTARWCTQVLPQDVDSQHGIAQSPIGPSPSQSPLAFQPFGSAPSGPPSAYTSALARSTSASGSGKISKLSRSTSGNTAATTTQSPAAAAAVAAVEPHDATLADDMRAGSPGADEDTMGAASLSQDRLSVPSATGNISQTDTLQDNAQAPEQHIQSVSSSPIPQASTASVPGSAEAGPQHQQSAQIGEDSAGAGVSQPSNDQSPTGSHDSAKQAPADAAGQAADESQHVAGQAADESQGAAGQAADESQHAARQAANESPAAANAPSETELQQSRDAVLSGEDQAMQESVAAANPAGGEQVKDSLPAPSLARDPPRQADCPNPTHPTLTPTSGPPSESSGLQGAASSPDVPAVSSAMAADMAVADVAAADVSAAAEGTSPADDYTTGQEQEVESKQAGSSGTGAEASDSTAAGQSSSSGQFADRLRSGFIMYT